MEEEEEFLFVNVEAAYGGGGRGMRVVTKLEDVKEQFQRAHSEAVQVHHDVVFRTCFIFYGSESLDQKPEITDPASSSITDPDQLWIRLKIVKFHFWQFVKTLFNYVFFMLLY